MSKVTFDGQNKLIHVNSGVISLDAEVDIYSEWKNWVVISGNANFEQALRTVGGDPTVAGQFTPKYFFLLNNWKVSITGNVVSVEYNLYSEDGTSPFMVTGNGAVTNKISDSPVITISTGSGLSTDEHNQLMSTLTQTQANSISAAINLELSIIAGLVQRNQRITNTIYDGNGNLLSSLLSIYPSATDANNETNAIKQFELTAIYNLDNQLEDYLVKEL